MLKLLSTTAFVGAAVLVGGGILALYAAEDIRGYMKKSVDAGKPRMADRNAGMSKQTPGSEMASAEQTDNFPYPARKTLIDTVVEGINTDSQGDSNDLHAVGLVSGEPIHIQTTDVVDPDDLIINTEVDEHSSLKITVRHAGAVMSVRCNDSRWKLCFEEMRNALASAFYTELLVFTKNTDTSVSPDIHPAIHKHLGVLLSAN